MSRDRHPAVRVDVCGGVASGKTTLAQLFRGDGQSVVLEDYTANPYWERFYEEPAKFAFETEISFLVQHYSLIKEADLSVGLHVFDFSPVQDLAYADLNLAPAQRIAFESVYRHIVSEIGEPNLLVHLVCGCEEELRRIKMRGRPVEEDISLAYLSSLNQAIEERVDRVTPGVRVITINSETEDFAHKRQTRRDITEMILAQAAAT